VFLRYVSCTTADLGGLSINGIPRGRYSCGGSGIADAKPASRDPGCVLPWIRPWSSL
jgi:hypothetical protein